MIEVKTQPKESVAAIAPLPGTRLLYVATVSRTLRGFLLPFVTHFRQLGWTVDGMARGITGCADCQGVFDRTWEAPWSRNPFHPNNLIAAVREIRKAVELGSYDIVHVHTPVAAFVTRLALRGRNRQNGPRVIYTAHGFHFHPFGSPVKNAIFLALEKLAGRWTDYLVTINFTDHDAAIASGLLPAARVRYMPGIGIDTEHYAATSVREEEVARVRAEIGITAEQPMLLMIAEFIPRKRHADVLRAVAAAGRHDFHIVFAGDGPTLEPMRALATELGINERTHFLGTRRDVPALIRASRAVLLPSTHEGLSRAVMESLSLQVPVIGTRIRGIEDLVQEDAGMLVPLGDAAELSGAISWILDNPEEAAQMGRAGRDRMRRFDLQHVVRAHEELYSKALEAKCPRK